jgi:phage virion morphogenesis protein
MLDIKIESRETEALLTDAIARLTNMSVLMATVGATLMSVTAQNFLAQGRPGWLGLTRPSERRQGGMILQDTGRLRDSIDTSHTDNSVTIGSNLVYAAIHQLGGTTRPHTIVPKNKQALAFNGRVVKKVNHPGSNIPARPFLPILANGDLQPEASAAIEADVSAYLNSLIQG